MFQNEERKATAERIRNEARGAYVNVRRVLNDPHMSAETFQNARATLAGMLLRAADRLVSLVRDEFSADALRVAGDLRYEAGRVLKGEPLVSAARTDRPTVTPVRTPHPEVSAPIPAGVSPDMN